MKGLIPTDNKPITSREIAELTAKRHDNLMRDIRNMEPAWEKFTETKFRVSEYTDPTGRKLPQYELSKKECLYIATKFNDEARVKLILRWEELELKNQVPSTYSQALKQAWIKQEEIERQQREIEAKTRELKAAEPDVNFTKAIKTTKKTCTTN